MISVDLAFPLAAGLIAAFNPCGFAMLPAYLSYFLGIETESGNNKFLSILNGLKVSLALSLGFVFVFATLGILTNTIISEGSIESRAGYITLAIGILLIILGLSMIRGFHPVINIPRFNITGINRQLASMFLFGVSYAFPIQDLTTTFRYPPTIFDLHLSFDFSPFLRNRRGQYKRLQVDNYY